MPVFLRGRFREGLSKEARCVTALRFPGGGIFYGSLFFGWSAGVGDRLRSGPEYFTAIPVVLQKNDFIWKSICFPSKTVFGRCVHWLKWRAVPRMNYKPPQAMHCLRGLVVLKKRKCNIRQGINKNPNKVKEPYSSRNAARCRLLRCLHGSCRLCLCGVPPCVRGYIPFCSKS